MSQAKKEKNCIQPFTTDLAVSFLMSDRHISREQALTQLMEQFTLKGMDEALKEIEMNERKKYLDNTHISEGDKADQKDKRWRANVRKADGKRTSVAGNSREEVEREIIKFYRKQSIKHSLESTYDSFFDGYLKNQVKLSTINRQKADYKLYIHGSSIEKKEFAKISIAEIENFLAETVIQHELCHKRYSCLKTIFNKYWDFAVYEGYTDNNTARSVRPLGRKFFDAKGNFNKQGICNEQFPDAEFADEAFPDLEEDPDIIEDESEDESLQYFTGAAARILILKCIELFNTLQNTAYLAIILCFFLGLRISELVALTEKAFDLRKNIVYIRLAENIRYAGEQRNGYYITKLLKTDDSYRSIPLSPLCKQLFEILVKIKEARGIESPYLLFNTKGKRMTNKSVEKALCHANEEAGLPQRSMHKIRKTVLSKLDMSKQFTLEQIRKWAGHSRSSITLFTNYFYTIEDIDEGIRNCRTFEEVVEYAMPDLEFVFTCIHF